ncbi:MAG: nucleoside-diphosphate kinase [Candidatus Omnitrophota bacterium]
MTFRWHLIEYRVTLKIGEEGMVEQTLVLIKPDGLKKSLTGNVLSRLSETKLEIVGTKIVQVTRELAEEHYRELKEKPFFNDLVRYIMGEYHKKKVMALVYWGEDAIEKVRDICGKTNPEEADAVSIRGAYGRITTAGVYENVIHASANAEDAEREIKLWFKPCEIIVPIYPVVEIEEKVKEKRWV